MFLRSIIDSKYSTFIVDVDKPRNLIKYEPMLTKKPSGEWIAFVMSRCAADKGMMRYHPSVEGWRRGQSPASTERGIRKAADILRCDVCEVTNAIWGMDSLDSVLCAKREHGAAVVRQGRLRANEARRLRYASDPTVRAKNKENHARFLAKNPKYKEKFNKFKTKEERREYNRLLTTQQHIARGFKIKPPKPIRQIISARRQLQVINSTITAIHRRLAADSRRAQRWLDDNSPGAIVSKREKQLLTWQVRSHARNQKVLGLRGKFDRATWYELMRTHEYRCAYCGALRKELRRDRQQELEIDHIHPVTSPICWNSEFNIVPACKSCNSSKSNNDLLDWHRSDRSKWHPSVLKKYEFVKALAAL